MADERGILQGEFDAGDPVQQRQFNGRVANFFDRIRRMIGQVSWGSEDIPSSVRVVEGKIIDRLSETRTGSFVCELLTQDSTTRAAVAHTSSAFAKGYALVNTTATGSTRFVTDENGEFEFGVAVTGAVTVTPVLTVLGEGVDGSDIAWA